MQKELHWIQMAQTKLQESAHITTFFVEYLETKFNIGSGALVASNYIIANSLAYKMNNFDDLAAFLKDKYDVDKK